MLVWKYVYQQWLSFYIFICVGWICSGTGKRMQTHKGTDKLSWIRWGSNSRPPGWGNTASCQLSSMFASGHWNSVKKHNLNDMPEAALDNWQPVWNELVSISTHVCVNFELRTGVGDIHICWLKFDALAQGNTYKPTKEPINYHGPGGDQTHDLQTEATPPAASCPARSLLIDIMEDICTPHWQIEKLFVLLFYIICLIKQLYLNKLMHTYVCCIVGFGAISYNDSDLWMSH